MIQFIGIYEWINSGACIFKDIGDIQAYLHAGEKIFSKILKVFFRYGESEESLRSEK